MAAESVLAPAGPADLDALLPMLERFNAGEGIPFDAAVARRALGELLARPELGRVYLIVSAGATVGYGALTFGWTLEWGGRDAFIDEIYLEAPQRGRGLGRAALRALMDEARARSTSRSKPTTHPPRRSTAPRVSRAANGACSVGG